MTILTPNGLILEAPQEDPNFYLQVWQLSNYNTYLATHVNAQESLAWLNFEVDEYE